MFVYSCCYLSYYSLFLDAKKLKSLRVNHNKLICLPSEVDTLALEECNIHHNLINRLPSEFLMRANKYVTHSLMQ